MLLDARPRTLLASLFLLVLSLPLGARPDGETEVPPTGQSLPCGTGDTVTRTLTKGTVIVIRTYEDGEAGEAAWDAAYDDDDPTDFFAIRDAGLVAHLTNITFVDVACQPCDIPGACQRQPTFLNEFLATYTYEHLPDGSGRVTAKVAAHCSVSVHCTPCVQGIQ